ARRLRFNALCPICGEEDKSVNHIFRDCNLVKQVLQQMKVISVPIHENQDWKHWLAETFNINNTYQCTCLAVPFWAIWHNIGTIFSMKVFGRGYVQYITELRILDEALESKHNKKEAH
ncbi:hypothetical protein Gotur_004026, partial [Gossypium turneri]